MFLTDEPINGKIDDKLNRTEFSKKLAQAILSYTKIDNFTIGLCGEWGAGKTSVINMVVEEIENLTESKLEEERPVIIHFNPWNYADTTQLISQFFETIHTELKTNSKSEKLQAVGTILQKYSSLFEYTAFIPVVGQYLSPFKAVLEGLGSHMTESVENVSLVEEKQKVIEALKDQKQKLIIIIDDIDRLNNEQIRLIFQLVNSLAGFPNMIYLLSFDRNVVVRALQTEQNCNGADYLEKIIQIPFEIPLANKSLINNTFCQMYNDIIFGENPTDTFEQEYWDMTFSYSVSPYIKNMRDVNRVINAFEFKYNLMKNEVNCIDLLALTTLQICAPEIYKWIYENISKLTGSVYGQGFSGNEQKEYKEKYLRIFESIYPQNSNAMMETIQQLFPRFSWSTGGYYHTDDSNAELMYKQRLASADKANRYFNLSLEDIVINKDLMLQVINSYDLVELKEYHNTLMATGHLYDYLHELSAYLPQIPIERRELFVIEMIRLQTIKENRERKSILTPPNAQYADSCMFGILKNNSKDSNHGLIKKLIEISTYDTIPYVCEIIESIERGYARIGSSNRVDFMLIEEDHILNIERLLLKKIKQIYEDNNLLDSNGYHVVELIWCYLEKESFDSNIKNLLKENINAPKYLRRIASRVYGSNGNGFCFDKDNIERFISIENALEIVSNLKGTQDFSNMPYEYKQGVIGFYIWNKSEGEDRMKISDEDIDEEMKLWEYVTE